MPTDTGRTVLGAVIAEPADDLPRLAYADLCEEHGGDARAEFIRAQCAYPEWFGDLPGPPNLLPGAVTRAWDLLHAGAADSWLVGLPGAPFGPGRAGTTCWERVSLADASTLVRLRRGFAAEVTLPCAAWLAHGAALVRAAPLERVTLSDRKPWRSAWPDGTQHPWWWVCAGRHNFSRPEALPRPLFRAMARVPRWDRRTSSGLGFPTQGAAHEALSRACLRWARAAAVAAPPAAG